MRLIYACLMTLATTGMVLAQAPDRTSAKDITAALTMRSKAMDVRPSMSLKVNFAFNAATLTTDGKAQLDELARALQSPELEGKHFGLYGHTDAVGKANYNQKLSVRRAEAVRAYLVERYGPRASPAGL